MKVLFAITALDRGGPDRVLFELLTSLDRASFTPAVLVSDPRGEYLSSLPRDIQVEVLGPGRYPIVRALRAIRRLAPDVVFATGRMILTVGAIAPLLPRSTRVVLRQANDFTTDSDALIRRSPIKQRVARWMVARNLRNASAVVCQSAAMQSDLRAILGSRATLRVIGNPIDVDVVGRAATAESVVVRGRPALVSVGRLAPQKGYDLLLPAVALLRRRHPDLHLTVYGDGPDRAALERLAREHGITDAVTFAGFTRTPLPRVRAADLFVLASRYEGFPNAALEALACGTPVVLTDCPGANREIVEPGVDGRLASTVDAAAMAEAIEAALADRYDRGRIIERCRERYDTRRIVGAYERVFSEVARAS